MIQRIQTVYLFLIALILIIPFLFPIAQVFIPNDASYNFYAYGVVENGNEFPLIARYWALLILYIGMILLPLINIFFYKKRFLQLRLCIVEIILLLGSLVLMWLFVRHFTNSMGADVIYKVTFVLPLVCVVFAYMAMRGITNDIKLLKSYDRIR